MSLCILFHIYSNADGLPDAAGDALAAATCMNIALFENILIGMKFKQRTWRYPAAAGTDVQELLNAESPG